MNNIIAELSQMPKAYIQQIKNQIYFSDEENLVFEQLLNGKTIRYIAVCYGYSERTISRRKKSISNKLKNYKEYYC